MVKRKITEFKSANFNAGRSIYIKSFCLLLILFVVKISFAQFQPDARLTNDPSFSYTSFNNAWCVAASGNSVHAVWYDLRHGNNEIFYKRSSDGGTTWGDDIRLTNDNSSSMNPSVSASGQLVHIVWQDSRDTNTEMYYKLSTDGGITWGSDTRLTNNMASSIDPSVTASGSDVHIVWWDDRQGHYEIYHIGSTDGGSNWGADTSITNNSLFACRPAIAVSGPIVHVVWYDNPAGNFEIYYKRSTDGGTSWGAVTPLTNNPAFSCGPTISVSGLLVHASWYDTRDGNNEIYYKRSSDGGVTWGADTRLTNNPSVSKFPSAISSGQVVHIVWVDDRDGNNEVYYKRSINGGISWDADTRLTNNSSNSQYPSVAVSGSAVHVVWNDDRDGNVEIYYKRDPTGNRVVILNLTAFVQGFYNSSLNAVVSDTAQVLIRNVSSPYTIIDSSKGSLNTSGSGTFNFSNAADGTNYYLVIKHRNSIETWSSSGNAFTSGSLTYDFSTSASNAYGNNQIHIDASPLRFGIFSGDVNQDGVVDATDAGAIDNDAFNFVTGYVKTDLTGNNFVDASDAAVADNNAFNFVSVVRP